MGSFDTHSVDEDQKKNKKKWKSQGLVEKKERKKPHEYTGFQIMKAGNI